MNMVVDVSKVKMKMRTYLPRGRGHSAWENDDAFCYILFFQDVE